MNYKKPFNKIIIALRFALLIISVSLIFIPIGYSFAPGPERDNGTWEKVIVYTDEIMLIIFIAFLTTFLCSNLFKNNLIKLVFQTISIIITALFVFNFLLSLVFVSQDYQVNLGGVIITLYFPSLLLLYKFENKYSIKD